MVRRTQQSRCGSIRDSWRRATVRRHDARTNDDALARFSADDDFGRQQLDDHDATRGGLRCGSRYCRMGGGAPGSSGMAQTHAQRSVRVIGVCDDSDWASRTRTAVFASEMAAARSNDCGRTLQHNGPRSDHRAIPGQEMSVTRFTSCFDRAARQFLCTFASWPIP